MIDVVALLVTLIARVSNPSLPRGLIGFGPRIAISARDSRAATDNPAACSHEAIKYPKRRLTIHPVECAANRYQIERPDAFGQGFNAGFDQPDLDPSRGGASSSRSQHGRFGIDA